jgi:hypothetical protein
MTCEYTWPVGGHRVACCAEAVGIFPWEGGQGYPICDAHIKAMLGMSVPETERNHAALAKMGGEA